MMGRLIRIGERGFLPLVALTALCSYIVIYTQHLTDLPIRSDGYSYYVYLPAWFICHDPSLQMVANHCCYGTFPTWTALTRWGGTGAWTNPHPIGTTGTC